MSGTGTAIAFMRAIIYSGFIAATVVTLVGQFVTDGDPLDAAAWWPWTFALAWLGVSAWSASIEDSYDKSTRTAADLRQRLRTAEARVTELNVVVRQQQTEADERAHDEWKRGLDSP